MTFNRHKILFDHYVKEIEAWDWNRMINRMCEYAERNNDYCEDRDGDRFVHVFIGTVFGLCPSGKFYMPWTTNQTRSDVTRDEAWWDALESVADQYECWIENGEGDPCDIFLVRRFDIPEEEEDYPDTTDGDHASALASAGWGTDEDYSSGEQL